MLLGHTVAKDGIAGKTCLSQWYPSSFTVDGKLYPTAEHWMMAGKAKLSGDGEVLQQIWEAPDPQAAEALGRTVRNFDDKVWKSTAHSIVTEGNYHTFSQNEELKAFLLATGDAVIVKASPRDQIWGIGLGQDNPHAIDPTHWRGQNLLGFALMDVRETLACSLSKL